MAAALDAILETIVQCGKVELVDPLDAGYSYVLEQSFPVGAPRLRYGRRGHSGPMCIRFPHPPTWPPDRTEAVAANFGTIVTAICAGIPVYQMGDGTYLPGSFGVDEPPGVVDESIGPVCVIVADNDGEPAYGFLDTSREGDLVQLVESRVEEARAAPRSLQAEIVLDVREPVVLRFADGTEMTAQIRTIEVRTSDV